MIGKNWEELLDSFEASGLTQKAFCIAQGLEHKQFLYRWNARSRLKKKNAHCSSDFESISVIPKLSSALEREFRLKIYLPNQISCEVGLLQNEVKSWIKELADVNSF